MMFLSLLALLASPADAGEVQVITASPVIVKVDGRTLEYPEGSMTVTAPQLAGGTHSVVISNLTGKTLAEVNVNVPVDQQVRLEWRNKQLTVLGSGPLPGGQVVVNQGASATVSVDDDTMSQLAALGYIDDGYTQSATVSAGGTSLSVTVSTSGGGAVAPVAPPRPAPVAAPVAPPPPVAMSASAFAGLQAAIGDESFSDDQLALLRSAASSNWFTCAQLGVLLGEFSFSDDRVAAAKIVRPRIVDPGNAYTLNNHLTFSDEKDQIQALFR